MQGKNIIRTANCDCAMCKGLFEHCFVCSASEPKCYHFTMFLPLSKVPVLPMYMCFLLSLTISSTPAVCRKKCYKHKEKETLKKKKKNLSLFLLAFPPPSTSFFSSLLLQFGSFVVLLLLLLLFSLFFVVVVVGIWQFRSSSSTVFSFFFG